MRIEIILSYQIHHYADERQIAPIVEKMKCDWRMVTIVNVTTENEA